MDCYKILKEGKEDINHEEGTDNSLNEYKLHDQTLKLVKEAEKIFPIQVKAELKTDHHPLNTHLPWPEGDCEACNEQSDDQSNLI